MLRNHGGGHAPVTNLELFFDLVFVFAITQLSHYQLGGLAFYAATIILFGVIAVWEWGSFHGGWGG